MTSSHLAGRRSVRLVTVLVASMLALSACGRGNSSDASGGGSDKIVVAATYPQSGALAVTGAAGRGVKAAIDEANADGGVNGKHITWVGYDDAYDPARMIANARKAVQEKHANVLVSFGGPSLAIRPFVNQHKVFNLVLAGNTAFSDNKTYPYTHAAFPDLEWEANVEAAALKKKDPNAKVGVIGFNNDLTNSQVAGVTAGGLKPVLVLKVPPSQQDVTSQITQLKSAGVDTIFTSFGVGQVIGAVKYMKTIKYSPTVVVYSAQAGKSDAITALGPAAKGIYTARWIADPADPLWAKASDVAAFKKAIANSGTASDADNILAIMGYLTGKTVVNTLRTAKGTDGDALNAAWAATKDVKAVGLAPGTSLSYGAGGRLVHTYQLVQWDGTKWQAQGAPVDTEADGIAK
jgi:branched-chain amino acid transport system substrate-binding protein